MLGMSAKQYIMQVPYQKYYITMYITHISFPNRMGTISDY